MFKRIVQEPLIHFALAGFLIFQYYSFNQNEVVSDVNDAMSIDVSKTQIAQLTNQFSRINLRAPVEKEINGLIENYIHEEVMYREALTLGLDKNDTQVRKRLKLKIEYLLEDISVVEITDTMLDEFLQDNTEKYRTDAILSFQQIFINPTKHKDLERQARKILVQSKQGKNVESLGDSTLLSKVYQNITESQLNVNFGREFTQQLLKNSGNDWAGPIYSEYGLHIIKINSHIPSRVPMLEEIRFKLDRDLSAQLKKQNKEKLYQSLREKYDITIASQPAMAASN